MVSIAAVSALESAYQVSPAYAATVREELTRRVAYARPSLAPQMRQQLSQVGERLSTELPRTRGSWRGKALFIAGRTMWSAGATDLAASLAYFTVLSFFPLVALMILVLPRWPTARRFRLSSANCWPTISPLPPGFSRNRWRS